MAHLAEYGHPGSLPTVFVIDAEGKLHSTDAQRELDTLIPRLSEKSGALLSDQ